MEWSYEQEWFEETNVARKIRSFLEKQGWRIVKFNEDKRLRGPDVVAVKGDRKLVIEVKGYPSTRYVRGEKKGKLKPTPPNLQAKHWFSEALLSVIRVKSQNPMVEIGIGLPKFQKYVQLISDVEILKKCLGIKFYMVKKDGGVETL